MSLFPHLNPQQAEAVLHQNGPLLVIAGAGSGKTRVVTERIVHLIRQGVHPVQILGVTFTNKAALEMRERVHNASKEQVLITTFHSLGARILRETSELIGYEKGFQIYDQDDSEKLIKQCLSELNLSPVKGEVAAMKNLISKAKNEGKGPEEIDRSHLKTGSEVFFPDLYAKYQRRLKEYNGVDFDDLLYLPLMLFKEHPEVLSHYQDFWHYLLIDEYQDTNSAQYQMVQHLIAKRGNLFAVGDPDQSIYSWRGADINNILSFEKDYPNALVIRLEENYRSTMTILEAANAVIQKNQKRLEKNLFSRLGAGELIQFHLASSESKEAAFVARSIEKYRQKGISYQEMAIFYRTNSQSRGFEDRLLELGIPYRVIGGISFYQRKEIKDILAFLRIVENGADGIAFARTINLPKRGFGDSSLEKLIQAAQERQMSILECALRVLSGESFSFRLAAKQKQALDDYLNIIYDLRRKKESLSIGELVKACIERTGYLQVLQEDPDSFEDRKQNLDELISKAFEWQIQHEGRPLSEFLEELTLQTSVEESGFEVDKVNLMTLHNGKGLEFEVSFISGLEEDLFPHVNSRGSMDGVEEERRLFYVGLTRAKKHLVLTASSYRMFWGQYKPMRLSRFLAEVPKHLVEKRGDSYGASFSESRPLESAPSFKAKETSARDPFQEGDIVFHQQFGIGKVLNVQEGSMGLIYKVYFQKDNQERSLIASLAPLTRL